MDKAVGLIRNRTGAPDSRITSGTGILIMVSMGLIVWMGSLERLISSMLMGMV